MTKQNSLLLPTHDFMNILCDISVTISNTVTRPSLSVRNIGVTFDSAMTMSNHIFSLCKTFNFHLRNLARVRMFIDETTCHHLIRALITSRLDYAHSLLKGSSGKEIDRLQRLQNRAAKLIFMAKKSDHVSPSLNNFTGFLFINLLIFKFYYF